MTPRFVALEGCGGDRRFVLISHRSIQVIDGHVRHGIVERFGQVVDHLKLPVRLVELDVLHFARSPDRKQRGVGSRS